MTSATVDVERLAARLADAEAAREPIGALTAEAPDLTVTEAYAVQRANVERRVAAGARVRGHKIGLTARSMQELFGIDEPDYGHLLDDMFVLEGSEIPMAELISPRVEVEPAAILGRDLRGPGVTVADVIRAVDCLVASIEVIDSRIAEWRIGLADTIADNGSSARVVIAGRPVRLSDVDLRSMPVRVEVDSAIVSCGVTGMVLGNPLSAIAWLANALGRQGVALEAGHVVLPGTPLPALTVRPGMHVRGVFDGLGDIDVRFSA
jgi:2-keto-4-pentenoate hydratase